MRRSYTWVLQSHAVFFSEVSIPRRLLRRSSLNSISLGRSTPQTARSNTSNSLALVRGWLRHSSLIFSDAPLTRNLPKSVPLSKATWSHLDFELYQIPAPTWFHKTANMKCSLAALAPADSVGGPTASSGNELGTQLSAQLSAGHSPRKVKVSTAAHKYQREGL